MVHAAYFHFLNRRSRMPLSVAPLFDKSGTPESFIVWLKFWYHIGISPFKLSISKRTGLCNIIRNRKLLVWNACLITLPFTMIFNWIHSSASENEDSNRNMNFFNMAFILGVLMSYVCFFLTMWLKSAEIKELVTSYASMPTSHRSTEEKDRWISLCIIWLLALLNQLLPALRVLEKHEWSFEKSLKFYQRAGRGLIFWLPVGLKTTTTGNILLSVPGFFLRFVANLTKAAMESLLIISARALMGSLRSLERRSESMSAQEGYGEYFHLKFIVQKNGNAVGLATCGVVFGYLPLITHTLPELIQPLGLISFVENVFNVSVPILFLTFTSWFTNKANNIFLNLFTNEKIVSNLPKLRLSIIFLELGNGGLLYDSVGWIKLTPHLLAEIICLTFTFAVVIVQVEY